MTAFSYYDVLIDSDDFGNGHQSGLGGSSCLFAYHLWRKKNLHSSDPPHFTAKNVSYRTTTLARQRAKKKEKRDRSARW